jgi:hypothetical protein
MLIGAAALPVAHDDALELRESPQVSVGHDVPHVDEALRAIQVCLLDLLLDHDPPEA